MKDALAATMTPLPAQLRRSLTRDRGKELSQHEAVKVETGNAVYFADPTAVSCISATAGRSANSIGRRSSAGWERQ
jgi:hypothetical protein